MAYVSVEGKMGGDDTVERSSVRYDNTVLGGGGRAAGDSMDSMGYLLAL